MILRLLLALLALLAPAAAMAACVSSPTGSLIFSQSSSYDLRTSGAPTTSAPGGLSCNGSLITILGSNYARATITSANAMKLKGPTGDLIPYTVSADAGGTYAFTQGGTIDFMNPTLLSLLSILNGGTFAPKLYATIPSGANVAAGTYTDTLTVNWAWDICHGVNVLNICILGETGTGTTTVTVSIIVSNDCRIVAPSVSFVAAPLAANFASITPTVLTDCTKGSTYKVAFTTGVSGVSRPWRTMTDGAGHSLQYNIYRTDGTTIWDETNPQANTAIYGAGALTPAQAQSYVAKINPSQTTPPAGHYSDTVSVVISF